MRGRHDTGKRRTHWAAMRIRYQRRMKRYLASGKKHNPRPGQIPHVPTHPPKWAMVNYPTKQHPVRAYVRHGPPWPGFPLHPGQTVTRTGGGPKKPPHWHALPPLRKNPAPIAANPKRAVIGKQRRVVMALGHKLGRLSGSRFFAAAAKRYFFASGRIGYPTWDPDHRLPVWP